MEGPRLGEGPDAAHRSPSMTLPAVRASMQTEVAAMQSDFYIFPLIVTTLNNYSR